MSSVAFAPARSQNTLCRYFISGACREGSGCRYSHDWTSRPSNVCRYHLSGNCSYGSRCRYVLASPRFPIDADCGPIGPPGLGPPWLGQQYYSYDHIRPGTAVECANSASCASTSASTATDTSSNTSDSCDSTAAVANQVAKQQILECSTTSSRLRADAPEFVPQIKHQSNLLDLPTSGIIDDDEVFLPTCTSSKQSLNYAGAVSNNFSTASSSTVPANLKDIVCPYFIRGQCWYNENCSYTHGMWCDMCNRPILHPSDPVQNQRHRADCAKEVESDMEASFAFARSQDKQCGICMEVVMEKKGGRSAQRFGILQNCKHCFCLQCIRKWRESKSFENKIVRACPECRTVSDFITPSSVWMEDDNEKQALIDTYKINLKEKPCKYFKQGEAECPFGNQCFYSHIKPDGTVVVGDSPRTVRRRMARRQGRRIGRHDSISEEILRDYLLWHFLEDRENSPTAEVGGSGLLGRGTGIGGGNVGVGLLHRHRRRFSGGSGSGDNGWLMELHVDELDFLSITSDSDTDPWDMWD